jgi:hypothetical protein
MLTAVIVFNGVVALLHYRHDRQRHNEAAFERARRKIEEEMEKAARRQENAANRLFSTASEAATQSQFSLGGKKPEVVRATWQGGWDGVEVHLPSATTGQTGNCIASALVRCTLKGDEIVVNRIGYRDPLKYWDISHLEEAAGALAVLVRNYPGVPGTGTEVRS